MDNSTSQNMGFNQTDHAIQEFAFCGPMNSSLIKASVLSNECFVDGLGCLPHILVILAIIPILIVLNKSQYGNVDSLSWAHFPGHKIRWILTFILMLLNISEIAEGILSDNFGTHLHLWLPDLLSVIAAIFTIAYYNNVEQWNSPRFLLLLIGYWICAIVVKILKAGHLITAGIPLDSMRSILTFMVLCTYLMLAIVEAVTWIKLRYAVFRKARKARPFIELESTNYAYSFVNLLSQLSFFWVGKLLLKGTRVPLELKHLGQLPEVETSGYNYDKFLKEFEIEKKSAIANKRELVLWKCYLKVYWPIMTFAALLMFVGHMLRFVGPLCLARLITYVEQKQQSNLESNFSTARVDAAMFFSNGYVLSCIIFLCAVLENVLLQQHHHLVIREAIRVRSALQMLIFHKCLRISSIVLGSEKTIGQVLNHMAVDCNNLMLMFFYIHYVWVVPLVICVCVYLLYAQLGSSAMVAVLCLAVLSPLQFLLARALTRQQKQILESSDDRLKCVNELIQGIKIIKLFAWEKLFLGKVQQARKKQLRKLLHRAYVSAVTTFTTEGTPVVMTLMAFSLYPLLESEPLSAGRAFSALTLFNLLLMPMSLLPMLIQTLGQAHISNQRLQPFFMARDMQGMGIMQSAPSHVVMYLPEEVIILPDSKHSHDAAPPSSYKASLEAIGEDEENNDESADIGQSERLLQNDDIPDDISKKLSALRREDSPVSHEEKLLKSSATKDNTEKGPEKQAESKRGTESQVQKDKLFDDSLKDQVTHEGREKTNEEKYVAVEIADGCFSWGFEEKDTEVLKDINFQAKSGELTVIVGAVGEGKSSLLSSILAETFKTSGKVTWRTDQSVAYCAQLPWIFNASLQDNILFGEMLNKKRYKRVLHACALQPDIGILPAGDQTEIGEKGLNLSGGQKQRVSLARALYSKADVILMDDPFSALDLHVGSHIFEDGILRFLLRAKRTVILVTHQLHFLPFAHMVYRMSGGCITHCGTLQQIKASDPQVFAHWQKSVKTARLSGSDKEAQQTQEERKKLQHSIATKEYQRVRHQSGPESSPSFPRASLSSFDPPEAPLDDLPVSPGGSRCRTLSHASSTGSDDWELEETAGDKDDMQDHMTRQRMPSIFDSVEELPTIVENIDIDDEAGKLVEEEERDVGSVSWAVYVTYVKAAVVAMVTLVLVMQAGKMAASIATNVWLAEWAAVGINRNNVNNATHQDAGQHDSMYYVRIYVVLSFSVLLLSLLAAVIGEVAGLRASRTLHYRMLHNVIYAPMRFFDVTPIGRILNRFSGDTNTVDEKLPKSILHLVSLLFVCLSAVIINAMATPYFLLAALPLCVVYYVLQKFFRESSRELQRLDSITKSPVMALLSECLNGLATVRAYQQQKRFMKLMHELVDTNVTAFLWLNTANRWLGIRLDMLGTLVVLSACLFSVTAGCYGMVSAGFVGLAIAYALTVCQLLNWVVRRITEVEMQMNSVERMQFYSNIEQEPKVKDLACQVAVLPEWPSFAAVQFRGVSLRYDESLSPVVRRITLEIKAGEKIGICGRTGSGKSSTLLSLLRMVDICEGTILIDGLDISTVPVETLRSRIAVIPQDPFLFAGTIRHNIDPSGKRSDVDIWQVLCTAQMKDVVEALPGKLDATVDEGGENFSVGQRQLLCLARALLRGSPLLLMDEAMAAVDLHTDQIIQNIIHSALSGKTVITVAHRVATIMDYDRVIVFEDGRIAEMGSPQQLQLKPRGKFASMLKANK